MEKIKLKIRVFDKEDYYTSIGEWDEVEEFCEENDLSEDEFNNLQVEVAEKDDIITIEVEVSTLVNYCKDLQSQKENFDFRDTDLYEEVLSQVNEKTNYELEISMCDFEILKLI